MPQTPRASTRGQIGVEMEEPQRVESDVELPEAEEQAPERPEWLPEKFKDETEFASSYRNLEDELRRRGEDQRRMEHQIQQLQDLIEEDRRQPQQPQQMGTQQELRDQLMAAYEQDPIGTIAYLAQQYAVQTVDSRFQAIQQEQNPGLMAQQEQTNQLNAMVVDRALADRYDDWSQYKGKVVAEIEADPTLLESYMGSPESTMRQLSRIYENVKAREVLAEAQNGNFVNVELNQMKRQATSLSGQGARPGDPNPDDEHVERLKAAARGLSYAAYMDSPR